MYRKGNNMTLDELLAEKPKKFCTNKKLFLFAVITLVISVCVGVGCYFLLKKSHTKGDSDNGNGDNLVCSLIEDIEKFDCYPGVLPTESQCLERGCCYNSSSRNNGMSLQTPNCYFPTNYVGYKIENITWSEDKHKCEASLSNATASRFPNDVKNLLLVITLIDDDTVRIKITDSESERFEVPIPLNDDIKPKNTPQYSLNLTVDGTLTINRKSSELPVFKTNILQLVYSDQFLQLSTLTTSPFIYGLGEHKDNFLRSVNWTRLTLFNQGDIPTPNRNLYGTHPFYIALEKDGKANGAFLYNSNAMDVILQPTPAVTFRPIGGVLDLFIFLGPTPQNVVQQYTNIVGRTFMPPYWSLGFHLCRYGYNTLNNTKAVYQRMKAAGIPYDVQWNDIDYMDKYMDFTYDKDRYQGLPEFVDELHANGMHYVAMIDPGVTNSEEPGSYPPYDDAVKKDLFVKNSTGQYFEGKVWNTDKTVFPDFSHPDAESYWEDQFVRFHSEVKVDGIWIDMNEPASFYNGTVDGCPESSFDDPPYNPGGDIPLRTMTLCMSAKHHSTIHYNEHNLLSYREAKATNLALRKIRPNQRPFIISRATFTGQGKHTGHWSGDIASKWEDMRYSIPSLLNFNIYGMSMIGSDICGFVGNTTEELCTRWQALGAFYPFSRNHNDFDTIEQDPPAMGKLVSEVANKTLHTRYYLLPYLYTLFYRSHVFGDTVIRPLFFEFSTDTKTYDINEQFLWGPALLINPVLYPNTTEVVAYFPKAIWYELLNEEKISSTGQEFTIPVPITEIDVRVRGGYILPLQLPDTTTTSSRKNRFELFVALDESKKASGELYWDDGETLDTFKSGLYNLIKFQAESNVLLSSVVINGYATTMKLANIKVCGVDSKPGHVQINSKESGFVFIKDCLLIEANDVPLNEPFTAVWM